MPRVTIWTRSYNPEYEAISKEIMMLWSGLEYVWIHDLSDSHLARFRRRVLSYNDSLYPLRLFIVPILEMRSQISHVFVSQPPDDRFYLWMLRRRPIVVTYTGRLPEEGPNLQRLVAHLERVDRVVVESPSDMRALSASGLEPERASLVYPGIDIPGVAHHEGPNGSFRVLFASAPLAESAFHGRGIELVLRALSHLQDVSFVFLWRARCMKSLRDSIERNRVDMSRLEIVNRVVSDMGAILRSVHAVIAPYTTVQGNKACPRSLMEGLASGRPVLASRLVGIADIIESERCGVVFEPDPESLASAIERLRAHYGRYQTRCQAVAERYFSKQKFVGEYERIYADLVTRR